MPYVTTWLVNPKSRAHVEELTIENITHSLSFIIHSLLKTMNDPDCTYYESSWFIKLSTNKLIWTKNVFWETKTKHNM